MFRKCKTTSTLARYQSRQPAPVLLWRAEGMNCVYGKRALHRRFGAETGVGPFKLLHNEAIRSVTQPRTAVLFQVRSIEAQCAHARSEIFRKFSRAMARHDLGHNFLVHKTPRPIACRPLIIREEFFDTVVIQRGHVMWLRK